MGVPGPGNGQGRARACPDLDVASKQAGKAGKQACKAGKAGKQACKAGKAGKRACKAFGGGKREQSDGWRMGTTPWLFAY